MTRRTSHHAVVGAFDQDDERCRTPDVAEHVGTVDDLPAASTTMAAASGPSDSRSAWKACSRRRR